MIAMKPAKSPAVIEPCVRYTPEEAARNKKDRDARRKAIRNQNNNSKLMK